MKKTLFVLAASIFLLAGCAKNNGAPKTISLVPASDQKLQSVYFGSWFPKVAYADAADTVIFDCMDCIYICRDDKFQTAYDLKETYSNVAKEFPFKIGAEGWSGINVGGREGEIYCIFANDQESVYYKVDLKNKKLRRFDDKKAIEKFKSEYAFSGVGEEYYYDFANGNYVALNLSSPDGLSHEDFHLALIEITHHKDGKDFSYRPFPRVKCGGE